MNKSRLIVFQLKEIIYTLIFAILGIILVIVLYNMFKSSDDKSSQVGSNTTNEIDTQSTESTSSDENLSNNERDISKQETKVSNNQTKSSFTPGIYATTLNLGDQRVSLEITVDQNVVKDVSLHNLNDTVTVSYPLLEPSVEYIEAELSKGTPLKKIECNSSNRYTHSILVETIATMLEEATEDK